MTAPPRTPRIKRSIHDYEKGDTRGRAAYGRARYEAWRQEYPDRAAIVDALPKGQREPCQRCGQSASRGPHRTKRRWDWDDLPEPTYIWMCNECWRDNPFMPGKSHDTALDQAAIDRLRASGIANPDAPDVATGPPPGYRIEGNRAYRIDPQAEAATQAHMYDIAADGDDDDDQPDRPGSKLDSWFAKPIDDD